MNLKREHYGYSNSHIVAPREAAMCYKNLTEAEAKFFDWHFHNNLVWNAVLEQMLKIVNKQGKENRYDFLKCIQSVTPNMVHYRQDTHTSSIRYILTHRAVNNVMLYLLKQNPSLLFQEWNIKLSKTVLRTILYEIDDQIQEIVNEYKKIHAEQDIKWRGRDMNIERFKKNMKMLSEEEQVFLRLKWGI